MILTRASSVMPFAICWNSTIMKRLFLLCVIAMPLPTMAAEPPVARRVDTVERVFGLEMPDPYRWMEGDGRQELVTWLKAHGEHARGWLDARPTSSAWKAKLTKATSVQSKRYAYQRRGTYLFFLRDIKGGKPALIVRGANGRDRTLFDPAKAGNDIALLAFSPSADGRRVALNIGKGGSESGELRIYDVVSGKRLGDTLSPVWSTFWPSWLSDNSGFFYNRMASDPQTGKPSLLGSAVFLHRLGRPQSEDRRIVTADGAGPLHIAEHDLPDIGLTPDSQWAVLVASGAAAITRICVTLAADLVAQSPLPQTWRCLVDEADNVQGLTVHKDTLYLRQQKGAPNARVVAIDLRDPAADLAKAVVVVPEREDAVLVTLLAARDGLYLRYLSNGIAELHHVDYRSGKATSIRLPSEGNNVRALDSQTDLDGVLFSSEGWLLPSTYYQYDPTRQRLVALDKPQAPPIDISALVLERIEARSADGTMVPLTLIHRRDHKRDGSSLALIMGYGAYGIGMRPRFDPLSLSWANAGHVYAICHVRGGDEKGDAWRIGGVGPNKQRGVEDFIACAKTLAERGDSSPRRIGAVSESMGGVLLGGAYVTAPEAFGAMAVTAGEFNVTRLLAQNNGLTQITELGDPRTEAGMRQLYAMDPYQRVRDGVRYPPLMLSIGLEDQRVDAWHSGKMAARLMHASPETKVFIRVQGQSGHIATSEEAYAQEAADFYAMFESLLGAR
jgi:prolyl oligopeptidase